MPLLAHEPTNGSTHLSSAGRLCASAVPATRNTNRQTNRFMFPPLFARFYGRGRRTDCSKNPRHRSRDDRENRRRLALDADAILARLEAEDAEEAAAVGRRRARRVRRQRLD